MDVYCEGDTIPFDSVHLLMDVSDEDYIKISITDETEHKSTRMAVLTHVFLQQCGKVIPIPNCQASLKRDLTKSQKQFQDIKSLLTMTIETVIESSRSTPTSGRKTGRKRRNDVVSHIKNGEDQEKKCPQSSPGEDDKKTDPAAFETEDKNGQNHDVDDASYGLIPPINDLSELWQKQKHSDWMYAQENGTTHPYDEKKLVNLMQVLSSTKRMRADASGKKHRNWEANLCRTITKGLSRAISKSFFKQSKDELLDDSSTAIFKFDALMKYSCKVSEFP